MTTAKTPRYYVIVIDEKGRAFLSHRGRDNWTLKTAIRYALECKQRHGTESYVISTEADSYDIALASYRTDGALAAYQQYVKD